MTNPQRREMLTVEQVADHLRVSRMTIYRVIHAGDLPAVRIGRSIRIDARDIKPYLDRSHVADEPYADGVA